ncbi:MAG: hypothetical protein GYB68_16865, partial [Chloroflexi bacterium]|nr:hypothetical protein [Chloroflexota bacterium]
VIVSTDRADYRAKVVVAADGATSTVRRKLKLFDTLGVARLLRVMAPADPDQDPYWQARSVLFDFSCVRQGIPGYSWQFPTYRGDQPYLNLGIMDSRIDPTHNGHADREHGLLKRTFANWLAERDIHLDQVQLEGYPVRWFNPHATFSWPHVLLVGDAAGVDPLFAEGISYAMEYGQIAAQAIHDAFTRDDFSFTDYRSHLIDHRLGQLLKRRTAIAQSIYNHRLPPFWSLLWWGAARSPRVVQHAIGASMALLPE